MQRHIVDVVARAVRIVRIVVVRLVHSRRLAVEERRQFLEQKNFPFVHEPAENARYQDSRQNAADKTPSSQIARFIFAHACNDSSFRERYLTISEFLERAEKNY